MNNNNLQGYTSAEVATMTPSNLSSNRNYQNENVEFAELCRAIWAGKFIIIIISTIFAFLSIIYALKQPNIYRATTLLVATDEQGGAGGLAKMAGQIGGLASLAGINLGSSTSNKSDLALEIIKSRLFLETFISEHDLLVPLIAAKGWNQAEDKLIYDTDVYDVTSKKWIREASFPKTVVPSSWESYEAFRKTLFVSKNKETGMITIAIEHYSPQIAKKWLLLLVQDINKTIREQDKEEAQNSIDFLSGMLKQTEIADMQTIFYQLIEEQTKTIMLAEVSKEYVLKTVDPANTPDNKSKPKRALIVILSTVIGGILSVLIVLVRYFNNKSKQKEVNLDDRFNSNS